MTEKLFRKLLTDEQKQIYKLGMSCFTELPYLINAYRRTENEGKKLIFKNEFEAIFFS